MAVGPKAVDRRSFVGGSDARVIMGGDEATLVRLWREKRGEVEPDDLADNLIVQLGTVTEDLNRRWFERNTGHAIKDVQRRVLHPVHRWMAATLDGLVGGRRRKAYGAAAAQYVGCRWPVGRSLDHYRRREVGRIHDPCRPAVPTSVT